jgi:hypothetical protein
VVQPLGQQPAGEVVQRPGARNVATTFIQHAITNLNGSPGSAGALFDALPSAEDAASLALAPNDVNGTPVYNFALAQVRFRDTVQAAAVRLFFRMWPAQQTHATYDPQTLYRSGTNASGQQILCMPRISSAALASRVAPRSFGHDDHRSCACGSCFS